MRFRRGDHHAAEPTVETESVVRSSPLTRWWVPRAVAGLLWLMVATAVAFAVLAWARPAVSSAPTPVVAGEEVRWDVAGFAELFVAQFVDAGDGDEALLAPFLGGKEPASLTGAVPGDWFASSTTTTATITTGRDRWRVTVAAGLLRRSDETESYVSMGVRHFEVEVVSTASGLSATGLPWIAAAPTVGDAPPDEWSRAEVPRGGDPLADTAERFLNALLTGNGELGRYAAPGSDLRAVPATFEQVALERVAQRRDVDGDRWVRVWAAAMSADSTLWLTYDLQVEERDGRWEIAAMGPDPVALEPPEIPVPSTTPGAVDSSTQGS